MNSNTRQHLVVGMSATSIAAAMLARAAFIDNAPIAVDDSPGGGKGAENLSVYDGKDKVVTIGAGGGHINFGTPNGIVGNGANIKRDAGGGQGGQQTSRGKVEQITGGKGAGKGDGIVGGGHIESAWPDDGTDQRGGLKNVTVH